MHSFAGLVQLALFALPILATPVTRKATGGTTASHIIKLKDGVDRAAHVQSLSLAEGSSIIYDYSIINGFAGKFSDADLAQFKAHNDVEYIEEDGIATILGTEYNSPWGLNRISTGPKLQNQDPSQLSFTYTYNGLGAGVSIYVVDTGIYVDHPAFEGRAVWGKTFGEGYPDADDNGHGTHCAGSAMSYPYGVAQYAQAIAVKVLGANGKGKYSDIVAGLNWVGSDIQSTGRLGLVSMSVGSNSISRSWDDAVRALISSDITVVIAAGNSNVDASHSSPADVQEAIVVGASNITDVRADFSNFGATVDLFAPGVDIISTWIDGSTMSLDGTSMATPHVAGQAAVYLAENPNATPAEVEAALTELALPDQLSDIPSGTVNLLLNNGFIA